MPVDDRWAIITLSESELPMATIVGGISLGLRHARIASRSGFDGIAFVGTQAQIDELTDLFESTPAPEGLAVVTSLPDAPLPEGRHLSFSANAVYAPGDSSAQDAWKPLAELAGPNDRKSAERRLFAQLRKSIALDGVIAYFAMRPLARIITRAVLNTKVSPNHATLFALVLGLAAALSAGFGTPQTIAVAGILYWFGGVVDCIDGELARMRLQSSKLGEWLDSMVDEVSTLSLMLGLGIGLYRDGAGIEWLWASFAGIAVASLTLSSMYRQLHREQLPIDTAQFPWFFGTATSHEGGPTSVFGYVANAFGYVVRRDANLTATAIVLILNLPKVCLSVMLIGYAMTASLLLLHRCVIFLRNKESTAA